MLFGALSEAISGILNEVGITRGSPIHIMALLLNPVARALVIESNEVPPSRWEYKYSPHAAREYVDRFLPTWKKELTEKFGADKSQLEPSMVREMDRLMSGGATILYAPVIAAFNIKAKDYTFGEINNIA